MPRSALFLSGTLLALLTLAAGCGGSSGTTPSVSPAPTATPTPTATPAPAKYFASAAQAAACAASNTTGTIKQPPAGAVIIVYAMQNDASATMTGPTGFTDRDAQHNSPFTFGEWYKIATGSGETSFDWGTSSATVQCNSWVIVFTGEPTSAPFDGHSDNLSKLLSTDGPFSTTTVTAKVNDVGVSMLNTGSVEGMGAVASFVPSTMVNLGSAEFNNFLFYSQPLVAGPFTASLTFTAESMYNQIEVEDLIAP